MSIAFNLTTNIYGFVYTSKKDKYHMFWTEAWVLKRNVILSHELKHVIINMPATVYVMGIDMKYDTFEKMTRSAIIYMGW